MKGQGVGARVLRKEDDRLMRGRGRFVADLRFCRHQRCRVRAQSSRARAAARHNGSRGKRSPVFAHHDLDGVKPIRALSGLRGFKPSEQTVLASDKVRYVGEPVAMCVAPSRAQAEDIAGTIALDLAELPAVHDMLAARDRSSAPRARAMGRQCFSGDVCRRQYRGSARCADQGHARNPHRAPVHGADRRPRRGRAVGFASGAAHDLFRLPDAAHRAHRPVRVSRSRRRPGAESSRPMSAAASATRESCSPRKCASAGSRCGAAIRCAGSRIAASI